MSSTNYLSNDIEVIISLIDDYQSDGAQWELDGVNLNQLKGKLMACKGKGKGKKKTVKK